MPIKTEMFCCEEKIYLFKYLFEIISFILYKNFICFLRYLIEDVKMVLHNELDLFLSIPSKSTMEIFISTFL